MKRILLLTLGLMMAFGTFVWADDAPWWGARTADETTLTGTLTLAQNEAPMLRSGGQDYVLRVAPVMAAELDLRSGQTITVEGYAHERARPDLTGTDTIVRVTALESDGDRVIMPEMGPGAFGRGHRSMMGSGEFGPGMSRGGWAQGPDADSFGRGARGYDDSRQGRPGFGGRR